MTDGPLPDLHFSCPKCGQHLKCEFDLAGTETDCPLCSAVFNIPAADHSGTDTVIEVPRTTPRNSRRKLPIAIALGTIAFGALLKR